MSSPYKDTETNVGVCAGVFNQHFTFFYRHFIDFGFCPEPTAGVNRVTFFNKTFSNNKSQYLYIAQENLVIWAFWKQIEMVLTAP